MTFEDSKHGSWRKIWLLSHCQRASPGWPRVARLLFAHCSLLLYDAQWDVSMEAGGWHHLALLKSRCQFQGERSVCEIKATNQQNRRKEMNDSIFGLKGQILQSLPRTFVCSWGSWLFILIHSSPRDTHNTDLFVSAQPWSDSHQLSSDT